MPDTQPPFRADHVGSLLRPPELLKARADHQAGRIDAAALRAVEDQAIRDGVALQQGLGLRGITDGEMRRGSWHMDFLYQIGGVGHSDHRLHIEFKNEAGTVAFSPTAHRVSGKLKLDKTIFGEDFGYLKSNQQIVVGGGPYITILPYNPAFICVPYYDPAIVFFAPRPGFAIGGAIAFNFGITIGAFFRPWGWGVGRFDWGAHGVFINDRPWGRTWANRATYVHPYEGIRRPGVGAARPAEAHKLEPRSDAEREAARKGQRPPREQHRGK